MSTLNHHKHALTRFIDDLFDRSDAMIDAVTTDGWPAPMVREGVRLHRRTWDVDVIHAQLERELDALLGEDVHLTPPDHVVHIWPTLPGAGLTPVLYGALLGVDQSIRPASEAGRFADVVAEVWQSVDGLPRLDLLDATDDWTFGDVVVVSGTDETLREVRDELDEKRGPRAVTMTGYGHRVSFGVVPDPTAIDLEETALAFGRDTVLWHQTGCFSLRGVLVGGPEGAGRDFAERLGAAIAQWEERLDARPDDPGIIARRTQAHNAADFEGRALGDGFGWAELTDEPFRGDVPAPHVVTCHAIDGPDDLAERVDLPAHHLQGVALANSDDRGRWVDALTALGATRICEPGALQTPPGDWLHDGRPNVLGWIRATREE